MRHPRTSRRSREGGNILFVVLVFAFVFGFLVTFFLVHNEVEARAARFRVASTRALFLAYGELEKAKRVIGEAPYDAAGKNLAIQDALALADRKIAGTDVQIEPLTGAAGTWYRMTVRVPFENSERIVSQVLREIDFFSSYNLFVSEHPAGVSGHPIGAIHTNRDVQFYFPGSVYEHSITAVEGATYKAGATAENTTITGPFNAAADRIDLDFESSDRFNLNYIAANVEPEFAFDSTVDVRLDFHVLNGEQWVTVEEWSKPKVEVVTEQVIVGYNDVNPHDEEYTYTERVQIGEEERTREIQVFDHYETVVEEKQVPVYVDDVRDVQVPVYRDEIASREVPVYRDETRTREKTVKVWVPLDTVEGGTAVGGDGASLGYWADQVVEETYTVQVIDHYDTEFYTTQVFDHYETQQETYQRLDHYDTVPESKQKEVYRTEIETYLAPIYEDQVRTATRTVYDKEPIYETRERTVYTPSARLRTADRKAPANGLIYAAGGVKSVRGDVVDRLTVATEESVRITGNLVYRDAEGDSAYLNGDKPWLPYKPNPDYSNHATLGLVARNDVLYAREVPDNFEINASMMAMTGRVGIEGVVLDADGVVTDYNKFFDEFGRKAEGKFQKNSIRRLGGITTAKRPIETVVKDGSIVAGFNVGKSVFDVGLLEGPPPFFLPFPIPRFFATVVEK